MTLFDYAAPTSLSEAVQLLGSRSGAQVLANGQRLIRELKLRQTRPALLIDLSKHGRGFPALRWILEQRLQPHSEVRVGILVELQQRIDHLGGNL